MNEPGGYLDVIDRLTRERDDANVRLAEAEAAHGWETWGERARGHREAGEWDAARLAADVADHMRYYELHIAALSGSAARTETQEATARAFGDAAEPLSSDNPDASTKEVSGE